jgi:uncharacterized membrane protein
MSDPSPAPDWATRTADSIERVVNTVRDRTTRPLLVAGRAIVFGLLAVVVGIAAVVLLSITIVRVLVILTDRAWLADLILGALFVIAGFVLLRLRRTAVQEAS